EQHRAEELDGGHAAARDVHTRSTTEERPRTKSPAGRSRSTRITSANTTDGRYTVLSVGRAPLTMPDVNPIRNPPSVAVQRRSMPPTTTPTSTMIVSWRAKSGVTNGVCTVRITATAAARAPESTTARLIT